VLAKEETENGVISVLQTTDCATILRVMIIVSERGQGPGSRRIYRFNSTVWATIRKYKMHGTLSRLPGSARCFRLTSDILAIIEEQMHVDDKTTATQLVKIANALGYDISKSTYNCSSAENSHHLLTINCYHVTDNRYVSTENFTDKPG